MQLSIDTTSDDKRLQLYNIRVVVMYGTTRTKKKIDMFIFCSCRIASNGSRRARYVVVVSQSNRNCDTVCRLILDNLICPMVFLGGHLRHFFLGNRATAQCDLC